MIYGFIDKDIERGSGELFHATGTNVSLEELKPVPKFKPEFVE
jgi:hypothetical protein